MASVWTDHGLVSVKDVWPSERLSHVLYSTDGLTVQNNRFQLKYKCRNVVTCFCSTSIWQSVSLNHFYQLQWLFFVNIFVICELVYFISAHSVSVTVRMMLRPQQMWSECFTCVTRMNMTVKDHLFFFTYIYIFLKHSFGFVPRIYLLYLAQWKLWSDVFPEAFSTQKESWQRRSDVVFVNKTFPRSREADLRILDLLL